MTEENKFNTFSRIAIFPIVNLNEIKLPILHPYNEYLLSSNKFIFYLDANFDSEFITFWKGAIKETKNEEHIKLPKDLKFLRAQNTLIYNIPWKLSDFIPLNDIREASIMLIIEEFDVSLTTASVFEFLVNKNLIEVDWRAVANSNIGDCSKALHILFKVLATKNWSKVDVEQRDMNVLELLKVVVKKEYFQETVQFRNVTNRRLKAIINEIWEDRLDWGDRSDTFNIDIDLSSLQTESDFVTIWEEDWI